MNKIFDNVKILVVGDIILDRYIWGDVSRISPEAPVPVVDVNNETITLGGAANVVHNIIRLGAKAVLCGVIGPDTTGGKILSKASELGLEIDNILVDPDRSTTLKTRVVGGSQQIVRFDEESREKISDGNIRRLLDIIKERLKDIDGIIVSDYNKGVVTALLMSGIRDLIDPPMFVISDPHKDNFKCHKYVNLLAPNKEEAGAFCGFDIKNEKDLKFAAKKMFYKLRCASLLITQGRGGMALFEDENKMIHIPTVAKDLYDVSGAGDTVVAALSLGLASGMDLEAAVRLANKAAGVVVGKMGTATINIEELNEVL